MTTHVSADQVRWWLDDNTIQDVTHHSEEGKEFNFEVTMSRLPIHIIKREKQGPIRIVGRTGFDTDLARQLVRAEDTRTGLLAQIGPVLASTPGFYAFLDEERNTSQLRNADILQMEHRIYPNEASQQALMDSLMSIATGMRYIQNTIAVNYPNTMSEETNSEEEDSE